VAMFLELGFFAGKLS